MRNIQAPQQRLMPGTVQGASLIGIGSTQECAPKASPLKTGGRPYGGHAACRVGTAPSEGQSKFDFSIGYEKPVLCCLR